MNPIRIALGVLLAALIAGPAWSREQSAPPAKQTTPPATQADQPAPAASDSKPVPVKVGGAVEQATLIHMVRPVYPKEAKEAGISGTVVLKGVIAKDGSLQQVEYVSGPEELKQAAIEAVKRWQYNPTTLAGKPIDVDTTINIVFAPPLLPHNAPARIRVGGNVQARNLVHQVFPNYPQDAKSKQITGTVVLHVIVAPDGSVQTVEVVSGPDALVRSAVDAVKQWRYKPTLLNGQPVEVDTTVQVIFSMG